MISIVSHYKTNYYSDTNYHSEYKYKPNTNKKQHKFPYSLNSWDIIIAIFYYVVRFSYADLQYELLILL